MELVELVKIAIIALVAAGSVLAFLKKPVASAGASLCANVLLLVYAFCLLSVAADPVLLAVLGLGCFCVAFCIAFRRKIDPSIPSLAIALGSFILLAGYICAGEDASPSYALGTACGCVAILLSQPLRSHLSKLALTRKQAIALGAVLIFVGSTLYVPVFFFWGEMNYGIGGAIELGPVSVLVSPLRVVLFLSGIAVLWPHASKPVFYSLCVMVVCCMLGDGAGPTICLILGLVPLVWRTGGTVSFVMFLASALAVFLAVCLPYLSSIAAKNTALVLNADGSAFSTTVGIQAIMNAGFFGFPVESIPPTPSAQAGYALASVGQLFGWVGIAVAVAASAVVVMLLAKRARTAVSASCVACIATVALLGLGCFATPYVYPPLFAGTWEVTTGEFLVVGVLSVGAFCPSERKANGRSSGDRLAERGEKGRAAASRL